MTKYDFISKLLLPTYTQKQIMNLLPILLGYLFGQLSLFFCGRVIDLDKKRPTN